MKRKTVTALALALAFVLAHTSSQFATVVTATSNNSVVTGTGNNSISTGTGNNTSSGSDVENNNTGSNAGNNTGSNAGNNTGNNAGNNTGSNTGNNNVTATDNNTYPGAGNGTSAGSGTNGAVQLVNGATVNNSSAVSVSVTTEQADLNAAVGLTADMIAQGQTLNVVIANSQCGELARAAVNNAAAALKATVAIILDIDLNIISRNGEVLRGVTELSAPIEFVISTPAIDGNAADYDFAVVRLHDGGEVAILPDLDENPATITFATDRFSVYAVIYGDKGAFDSFRTAAKKDSVPQTGSAMPSTLPFAVAGMIFATVAVVLKQKKEA